MSTLRDIQLQRVAWSTTERKAGSMTTKEYYELHITMKGPKELLEPLVKKMPNRWTFSAIDGDPIEGPGIKCYATKHYRASLTRNQVQGHLTQAVSYLRQKTHLNPDIQITREKIELVIHDVRYKT